MNKLGEAIAYAREEVGISQRELAEDINCPRTHISDIENGKRKPSNTTLKNIAYALGLEVDDFV